MIELQKVCKTFQIPHQKRDTLRDHFLGWWRDYTYESLPVLHDVTLDLKPGQWLGIIGANGSGKSTLLKIIAGIFRPDRGQISVEGKIVPLLELGIGFHPDLTVEQNIRVNGTLLGLDSKRIEKEIATILQFAEIEKFRDTKLKNLSSGMRLRLAFAIATKVDGDIFLLDEVWAVGDAAFQKKCQTTFQNLRKKGKTVVLVSHDLSQVRAHCDQVLWLERGQVRQLGHPDDVLEQYAKS